MTRVFPGEESTLIRHHLKSSNRPENERVIDRIVNAEVLQLMSHRRTHAHTRRRRDEQQYAVSFHVIYLRIQGGI
jgi:hypothetical protein